jgi:hypothetical protein
MSKNVIFILFIDIYVIRDLKVRDNLGDISINEGIKLTMVFKQLACDNVYWIYVVLNRDQL